MNHEARAFKPEPLLGSGHETSRVLPLAALAVGLAGGVCAQEATRRNNAATFLGTTCAYQPPGGPWSGFQHDLTLLGGYGRYVSSRIALELSDVGKEEADFGVAVTVGVLLSF